MSNTSRVKQKHDSRVRSNRVGPVSFIDHSTIQWAIGVARSAPSPIDRARAAGWLTGIGKSGFRKPRLASDEVRAAYDGGRAEGEAALAAYRSIGGRRAEDRAWRVRDRLTRQRYYFDTRPEAIAFVDSVSASEITGEPLARWQDRLVVERNVAARD